MRRTAAWWSETVAEAQKSELSMREFARSRGLNANTLAWWKWRLDQDVATSQQAGSFLEVAINSTPLRLQICGAIVDVDDSTDLRLLRRVVEALA